MYKNLRIGKRTFRSILSVLMCLLLTVSLLPMAAAIVPVGGLLQTEQPVLVVTGQDLPGGARGSADNVSNEKAYTMDELRAMEGLTAERLYTSINSSQSKRIYRAQGVDLEGLLALSGYTELGKLTSIASDSYTSTLDLSGVRSIYPNYADDDASGAEVVKPILAWKNAENRDVPPVQPEPFATMNEEPDDQAMRIFAGQLDINDVNSTFFNRNVVKLIAGDAIEGADITVCGVPYSRADILLMPRAEHSYTYTTQNGERTDTVRGVPLAVLLQDIDDNAEISFEAVDGWGGISAFTATKLDLVAKNAILTYEVKSGDEWAAYYRASDDSAGYFRLMVEGTNGAHMVNAVNAAMLGEPPVIDEPDGWAAAEVEAALELGLVPDSIISGGWKNPASRLAAAEAMVLLIEKTSGQTMQDLALEHEWDLTTGGFSDTDSPEVTFLKYAGVTNGMGDGTFAPDSTFTRAQAVTMIGRAAEFFFKIDAKGDNPFNDEIPDWAAMYVGYAAENNITKGEDADLMLFGAENLLQNQTTVMFTYRSYNVWK